jgi:photosystem II stability/assembly factor-like uncharacterized protein
MSLALLLASVAGAEEAAQVGGGTEAAALAGTSARPSERATSSLLLDVARAGDRIVAVGEWGHVVLSDDGGESWRQAGSVPTRATLTSVFFRDEKHGWAVGHDSVVLHSGDGGETWKLQHSAPEEERPLLSVWFGGLDHGIAVGAFGAVLLTRDGGESWRLLEPPGGAEDDGHLNAIFAGPEGSIFIAAERGRVHRSLDKGETWSAVSPGYAGSFWGGLTLGEGAVLVFGMRGHVFRSDDLGESWRELSSGVDKSLAGGRAEGEEGAVLVGLGGVVLETRDGGEGFELRIQPGRRSLSAVTRGANGRLLIFGETGIETVSE